MSKLGRGVHMTEGGDRIFVAPDVPRYPTEEGGEVVIVEPQSEAGAEAPEEE